MIVSYQHNFIFIRTRKTASSTIETFLRGNLGPDDLYVAEKTLRQAAEHPSNGPLESEVVTHMKAEEIARLVPESFWNTSYKFTSERHPYEKAVSLAYYNFGRRHKKGKETTSDFGEFLDRIVRAGSYRAFDYYTIGGEVVVDDFVRHERLREDLARIAGLCGIAIPEELPRKRSKFRQDARPAKEILSDEQKRVVFETCREEFELLGYEP